MPGRLTFVVALALVATVVSGCREGERELPAACEAGADAVGTALTRAPGEVRLDGGVKLSSCFVPESSAGEVQRIGATFVEVAADLALTARRRPNGKEATRLGYLMAAVRTGAARTQGIHDELLRRIEQELIGVDTATAAFRAGERAGSR